MQQKSAMVVAGWHRMSYSFPDHTYISQALEKLIREVHLVASAPYYSGANLLKSSSNVMSNVIELVTTPNNPDGLLRKPVLQGSFVNTIHDHAYYWPHFTAIPAPSDEDVMIFTLSKLTGHAGSRFGWALIRDADVYEKMNSYISISEMGIPRDTQLRALPLLRAVLEGDGRSIFDFAHEKMRVRLANLTQIISKSQRFTLQDIAPQYCSFYQKVRGPSPAYAWLKCEKEEDMDCFVSRNQLNQKLKLVIVAQE